LLLWLCISVFLSYSSYAVDCSTDTVGLCTPTIEEIIQETITEEIIHEADGITTITTTTHDITTTTVTNEDSGNILDSDNDFVVTSKDGEMDIDWGGQGPASMPSGNSCGQLGTDKCAMITGSGNSVSANGVSGMGTTFVNTIDISDLNIKHGGQTNYSIKVDKQDASDSIYMHITGKNGSTNVFSGTDILSASGTNSGYQTYENSFDFAGSITSIVIEIGGRDINLAVGPLFDSVQVNVLYNVINTIITQQITTVEMFIALNIDAPEDVIDLVEDVFDANDIVNTDQGLDFTPIEIDEPTYQEVEIEIEEIQIAEIEIANEIETEIETVVEEVEPDMDTEVKQETTTEDTTDSEPEQESEPKQETETQEEVAEEESKQEEVKEKPKEVAEKKEKPKEEPKKETAKEKAAKKIVKKMDNKKRYDSNNQMKTLIVMQVLGNSKTFFDSQKTLLDRQGFFSDAILPDTIIPNNNMAQYLLFAGSDGMMNEMIEQQWRVTSE